MAARFPRGAYLLLGFVMNFLLGTAYAWSVFNAPLIKSYGATDFTAQLPFALALAMFSVGMVFAGRLVDRHGPRKVAMVGGVLVGAGYMLSFLMDRTPWPMATLTLTYGVVAGLGIGFAYNPPIMTAVRWYPVRKGLASGLVVMGFGLSALITAPLSQYLIAATSVPMTFLILGAVFVVVLVALGSTLRFPEPGWQPPVEIAAKARRAWQPAAELTTREMVRTPAFWTAWLLYTLGTAGGFMVIAKAKPIAADVGLVADAVLATAAVQLLAVFNSGGRPLFGRLADVWGPKRTLLLMYGILLGTMVLLYASSGAWVPVYAGIALTGLVFGGFLAVMPALATLFFGAKNSGQNYGVLFTGYGSGAILALFTIGWIKDLLGSYAPAFEVGAVLSVAGIVLSLGVRPPRPAAASVPAPTPGPALSEMVIARKG